VWLAGWLSPLIAQGAETDSSWNFDRDIKPLLRSRCVACHGPITREAGLRLDAVALVHRGGDSGAVITPEAPDSSLLLARVTAESPEERMPPKGAPLTVDEVALLRTWIAAGAPIPSDEVVAPDPREHWAFQPIRHVEPPEVMETDWSENPIDRFVAAKLAARGWRPNPIASPAALLRRVHLDLHGLPPTLAEQEAFLADPSEAAYERLVDTLLNQPAYGERFARHWLDVVRYADSNGYERDAAKPEVWKYRDYVIRALNDDRPFDRFLLEQIAGDELPDATPETMLATGFHRLGPWDDEPADPATDQFDQLDDLVGTVSQAFLGLTMGCARCHDHKFDPLTQRDYYGMVAVFRPLIRPREGRTELTLPVVPLAERQRMTAEARKAAPQGYFWDEPATPPPATFRLVRGSPHQPAEEIAPAIPAILTREPLEFLPPGEFTSQRRLSLAKWLAGPGNPLVARVIVNRVWQWHFGEGLVRTPNDFGLTGERPTHPELLEHLAHWFVHDAEWSLKRLHRLIVTSRTWRQSRAANPAYVAADPENRLLGRRGVQRLEIEPLRDAILAVSGRLDRTMYGPPIYPLIPREALESHADKTSIWPAYDERAAARRTVYAFTKRSLLIPLLEVFDLCDTTRSAGRRGVTTVPTQALTLYNSDFIMEQAAHFARRLEQEAGPDRDRQLDLAWRLAFCRRPTDDERVAVHQFLADQTTATGDEPDPVARDFAARVQLARVVFNLNEFAYPD
jgi:hypothetical protein